MSPAPTPARAKALRRGLLAAEVREAGRGDDVLVRVPLAGAENLDAAGARVSRAAVGRADHHGGAAVGDQAAVEQAQRRGDHASTRSTSSTVIGVAHLRLGMAARRGARCSTAIAGKVLQRRAVLVHVAPRDQRVGRRHADAVRPFELRVAHFGERRHRAVARHAREPVVAGDAQHVAAVAARHQRGRLHHHDAGGGAAGLHRGADSRGDAEVLAEHRGQHQVRLGERIRAQHAVDVGRATVRRRRRRRAAASACRPSSSSLRACRPRCRRAGYDCLACHLHFFPSRPNRSQTKPSGFLARKSATAA